MLTAFLDALRQLPEPEFRRVLWRAMALTLAAFVVIVVGFSYLLGGFPLTGFDWLDWILVRLASATLMLALFLVFPSVATLLVSVFLDEIAEAVERRHYADDPPGRPLSPGRALGVSLQFTAALILTNVLALPLYLIPGINLFVFYGLNGYLLSREYFELVALRHLDVASARRLRRAHRGRLLIAGVVIAFMLTVPIVNIVAPIVATAFMAHIFKALEAGSRPGVV